MNGPLVLVVDDDPKMRELLQIVLESAGFRVRAAGDGETALKIALEEPPALVVADVVLPKLDGLGLARRLREELPDDGVPVLLISGIHRESMLGREAAKAGVAEYMAKPLDLDALVATCSRLTGVEADGEGLGRAARRVKRLRHAYLSALPERVSRIEEDWDHFLDGGGPPALERVHRAVHSMAGTAGTLGLQRLGELAREIEDVISHLLGGRREVDPAVRRRIGVFLRTVKEAFGTQPQWVDIDPADRAEELHPTRPGTAPILLVEDEETLARNLVQGLQSYGYPVRWVGQATAAREAGSGEEFLAVILDLILEDDPDGGLGLLQWWREHGRLPGPVLILSRRQDLDARLQAVRLGAQAYLGKPVAVETLVDTLERMAFPAAEEEPWRVLEVHAEPETARRHAEVLTSEGIVVEVVSRPEEALPVARQLNPDLVLIDQNLPCCSGLELAQVLRQEELLAFVPIVITAQDDDPGFRLEAISSGVVDVLTVPVPPELLVAHCRARAARGRALRRLGSHDALTGALNHGAVLEWLRTLLARQEREGAPLAVAMVDLDGFKSVNDTLGHLVGDRVLKTVARLLRARLRRSDVVGRYGGDEFLVVMPGAGAAQAAAVLAEVRRDLGFLLEELGEGVGTMVALSVGVADSSRFGDLGPLLEAADRALYRAKAEGGDRLIIAE